MRVETELRKLERVEESFIFSAIFSNLDISWLTISASPAPCTAPAAKLIIALIEDGVNSVAFGNYLIADFTILLILSISAVVWLQKTPANPSEH